MVHQIPIEGTLDLHTFRPQDTRSVVEEYVISAWKAGLNEIRLIHGRGQGIQRKIVHSTLDRNPLVVDFWDAPESHLGATIVNLISNAENAEG